MMNFYEPQETAFSSNIKLVGDNNAQKFLSVYLSKSFFQAQLKMLSPHKLLCRI